MVRSKWIGVFWTGLALVVLPFRRVLLRFGHHLLLSSEEGRWCYDLFVLRSGMLIVVVLYSTDLTPLGTLLLLRHLTYDFVASSRCSNHPVVWLRSWRTFAPNWQHLILGFWELGRHRNPLMILTGLGCWKTHSRPSTSHNTHGFTIQKTTRTNSYTNVNIFTVLVFATLAGCTTRLHYLNWENLSSFVDKTPLLLWQSAERVWSVRMLALQCTAPLLAKFRYVEPRYCTITKVPYTKRIHIGCLNDINFNTGSVKAFKLIIEMNILRDFRLTKAHTLSDCIRVITHLSLSFFQLFHL
jgi:hypothetical protein